MKISLYILLISLALYGCAAKKMAINNADYYVSYQIKKRLPLYSEQNAKLSKDIDLFLNNAKTQAQEILPVIDELNLEKPDEVVKKYTELEGYFNQLSRKFSALVSEYMAKLDKKQQKDFFRTLDDENREMLKVEKEKQINRIEERIEKFLGSVNGDQKQLIRESSDYFIVRAKERLDRRINLHQKFKSIYSQDLSPESREKEFYEAFVEYQKDALRTDKNPELLVKLLPTITKEQREHFRDVVKEVKEMLNYFISAEY